MEFIAEKSELLDELDLIQGAVEKKSTIPILSHFLMEATGSRLQITSSDLELAARTSCFAKVKVEGKGAVPARRLVEIVRSLPDGEIRFKGLENHWVQLTCQRSSFKLASIATDNFPALPELPKAAFTLPTAVLAGLIDRTMFAASQDENRFSLNGVLLLLKPESASMVATDGHRLALAERRQAVGGVNGELRMLIPTRCSGNSAESWEKAPKRRASRSQRTIATCSSQLGAGCSFLASSPASFLTTRPCCRVRTTRS